MPFRDEVNRILRDHEGYTGDGRGGVGELPIGDRSTSRKPISKADFRALFTSVEDVIDGANEVLNDFSASYDIRSFGAVSGMVDATAAIAAACLGGNRTVRIPAGVWNTRAPIRLYANTKIICDQGAELHQYASPMFINGEPGNTAYATGYDGDGNIHISGGDYYCHMTDSQGGYASFSHARNVSFKGMRCHSLYRGHYIEVNAIDGAVIEDCLFENQTVLVSDTSRDAINIDFAYEVGFPLYGAWDGTVCKNIFVNRNKFSGVQIAAGSHGATEPPVKQGPISITNNVFENMGINAVWGRYWDRADIRGNVTRGCGQQAFLFDTSNAITCSGNTIYGASLVGSTNAVQFQTCTKCVWDTTNVISNAGFPQNYTSGIRSFAGDGTNQFSTVGVAAGSSAVTNVTDLSAVNGEWSMSIPDNGVMIVPIPAFRGEELQIMVGSKSNTAIAAQGIYYVRLSPGGLAIRTIAKPTDNTTTTATGAFTGTTGAPGSVTVSAATNAIHVENRRGGSLTVTIRPLGGYVA